MEAFQQLDFFTGFLLVLCILIACGFEFVNGFHDTANAVATVIYTHSLKPGVAVMWSGICNFVGVFSGGIAVAMGIVNLLPVESLIDQNVYHSIGMVLAMLLTAVLWNLGTWWFGIPCSSSHTLIASIIGVGVAYSLLPGSGGAAVDWSKASEVGLSLLLSPVCGFGLTVILMFLLKTFVPNEKLFKQPEGKTPPPWWIRGILILTCTGVSFSHGSNDGQKGVGLVMLILIGILPTYYALDDTKDPSDLKNHFEIVSQHLRKIDQTKLSYYDSLKVSNINSEVQKLASIFSSKENFEKIVDKDRFEVRKNILIISKETDKLLKDEDFISLTMEDKQTLLEEIKELRKHTDYAPDWVVLMISLSLGIGTMVGWKRIVVTIGEKIGKEHLTYSQGACAEMAAASTIAFSTFIMKLPVSTTQVLSSGIAGSMVANKGMTNLQPSTLKSIAIAWILTFPVCVVTSGTLFLFFRWLF
ncbi:MAG: inorganic phosphate transporter [Cytophagaceae bacterium]|nr:inorganic phosphate transporter [Cytophagaceae bacterium]MDW8457122.1 inorganic phosphate transporter [Cytophagaceae bacterium]